MKKKKYQTPVVKTFEMELTQMLAASNEVTGVDGGGTGIGYGGGGSGPAHVPQFGSIWDAEVE